MIFTQIIFVKKGAKSLEEAIKIAADAIKLFKKCLMNLRQWTSSSEKVNRIIPEINKEGQSTAKVLRLKWDTLSDDISLALPNLLKMEPMF